MDNFNKINELKKLTSIFQSDNIDEADLFLKDEDGKTFFEYIVSNNITIHDEKMIKYITSDYELLRYATLNKYYFTKYYNIDLLFKDNDQPLIEIIFKNDPDKLSDLSLDIINRLFVENNGEYLIKKFADIDEHACQSIINKVNNFDTLYNCFNKINRLDLMKYANASCLLAKTPNGVTMMQELINMKTDFDYSFENDVKNNVSLAEILYQNKKYDLLLEFDCGLLLNYPSPSNNYFNMIINHYKNGEKINFKDVDFNSNYNKNIAICILTLLKNGINYSASNSNLLVKDLYFSKYKPVIIHMLEMDKDLTIEKLIRGTNLEQKLKIYISELTNCSIDELKDFNVYDIFEYLPKKENLIQKLKSKEKSKIEDGDIYIDDLLEPMEDGMTLLEYALRNNINIASVKFELKQIFDAAIILTKFNYELFSVKEEFLYIDIGENKKFIDLLFEKKYIDCIGRSYKSDLRILDYCLKYNNFDVISDKLLEELLVERDGKFLIEKYLSNDNFVKSLNLKNVDNQKLIKIYNNGYKNFLIDADEKILLTPYNGMTILEDMLKSNITPSLKNGFESIKTMEILYSYNKIDLMCKTKTNLKLLVDFPSRESNYLQYLIECRKKGINVHLELINYLTEDNELSARAYIQMVRNDFKGYLNALDENKLTKKDESGKSLLYYLINLDKYLTIDEILNLNLRKSPIISAELKLLGFGNVQIGAEYDKFDCDAIYRKVNNDKYAEGVVSPVEDLLEELRNLFYQDGESDKELIDALIISYRHTTSTNPVFIEELKRLIEIKKNTPNFYYTRLEGSGYFSPKKVKVVVEDSTISTLDHETGHALHYFLADDEVPENYESILLSINSDPTWIKRIEEYSKMYHKLIDETKDVALKIVSKYISEESANSNSEEINELLVKTKEERTKTYLEKGYSEETLDIIFSDSFTLDEFVKQKKQIEIYELLDTIMRYEYDAFIAIGDIIDAITRGNFQSNLLRNDKNEKIESAYGHGVRYYSLKEHGFDEMVANYSSIIKSKHSNEILKLLRNIVGDELVDLLDEFYMTKIIGLKDYEKEPGKAL